MGFFGNCRDLAQTAAKVQARFPSELDARCGAAGRAGRHRLSDLYSPFRPWPHDEGPSELYRPPGRKLVSFLAALLLTASGAVQAKNINALSPALGDVSTAIASAVDGDTVIVPAGKATWSSTLTISKGITLIGKTTTDTVTGSAVDITIIQDNAPRPLGNIVKISSTAGKTYRLSGFTFAPLATTNGSGAAVTITGNSHSVRIDHCHFQNLTRIGHMVKVAGPIYGVADHNFFEFSSGNMQSFNIAMADWNAPGNNYGDGSWADFPWYGTDKFWFMEDNYFVSRRVSDALLPVTDDYLGARWVFRHNKIYDMWLQTHGTEGARQRGHRACEVYNNEWHFSHMVNPGGIRSGGILTHDNTWYGSKPSDGFSLQTYRSYYTWPSAVWIGGSGDCIWDMNDTSGTSTSTTDGICTPGLSPHLYWSGIAATGTSITTIVASGTPGWKAGQWVNFVARRLSDNGIGLIAGNTSNTLTVIHYSLGGGVSWRAGDQYQIHKPLVLMDQNGRGKGDLIGGTVSNTVNSVNGAKGWPHQALEPCYSWNDYYVPSIGSKVPVNLHASSSPTVKANRDYYNLGIGATDAAVRSKYVAALNGVAYAGPYTYPHPLVSGISPPTNLQITKP